MSGSQDNTTVDQALALPEGFSLVDVIADLPIGQEMVDLSVLFASLPEIGPPVDAAAGETVTSAAVGAEAVLTADAVLDAATFSDAGAGTLLNILYDDTRPIHPDSVA